MSQANVDLIRAIHDGLAADGRAMWFRQYADTLAVARVTGAA